MNKFNVLNVDIDCSKIKTEKQYINIVSEAFKFPNYFNFNIDGMNECMRDLSWFSENYINIVFFNINKVNNIKLRDEIKSDLQIWKDYWDNIDLYENFDNYEKIVVITIL